MKYYTELDKKNYIFECDDRPIKEVKKLLKEKFNKISIHQIPVKLFKLLKSLVSIDNNITLIENVYKLEESLNKILETQYKEFRMTKTLKDFKNIDKKLYKYILEQMEDYVCLDDDPKVSVKIDNLHIDDYIYCENPYGQNITINLRVIDTELKQIDTIEMKLGFFFDTCHNYFWTFKSSGNCDFDENYTYECKTTDLDGNPINKEEIFDSMTLAERLEMFLEEIGFEI
ncbi:MAG: hypothetical protein CMF62_00865 [Magnetococcales bacterium]|nr:hypothetical protein [Magnetococcales bacterium]|tara:strand:+ start:1938 stop:2624 length:687 start_codon:yes stop_codon:yes gene_type:complete